MQSGFRDSQQAYAIIIGLDSFPALQAARVLAHRKVPVIAIARDAKHPNCRTNVCEKIFFAESDNAIIKTLETLGPKLSQKAVLYPCQDGMVLLISRNRQKLEQWYHVVLPAPDVLEMMMNKTSFYTYAQKEGLPIAVTYFLNSRADAEQAASKLSFPCALKPPHRGKEWSQHTMIKAFKVSDADELLAVYDRCHSWADSLIVQEWIEGGATELYSCNCYFDAKSEPIVTFIARKLRQWPPKTGTSALGEECRNDLVLQESIRLFRSVNYRGLGYVEMKRDVRSDKYYIVEPNIGRPTGRSTIAEAGGVELLYTMYCDAVGLPLPATRIQTYQGVKWVHLRRDTQSALYAWWHGELTLKEWWQSLRGRKGYALLSWSDPLPFLSDLIQTGRLLLSSQERRKRGL